MTQSEQLEEGIYTVLTLELLDSLQAPLRDLYDQMAAATSDLTSLSAASLQASPHIIKMLRYVTAPTISQLRLGQIAGIGSTAAFEERAVVPTSAQAERLATWFRRHLDRERFPWIAADTTLTSPERTIAQRYAKLCTVSLISNQNATTAYRNRRKGRQEGAIAAALDRAGLVHQPRLISVVRGAGGIVNLDNIREGHYVLEKKIRTGKSQKADLTARPQSASLYCIEAKAVGIRIDSTKRLKELGDKQTEWQGSGLPITTIGVCAGFFNLKELIATIRGRGIAIFWEHDLDRLIEFVQSRTYYGAPWNPSMLFPEIPLEEVRQVLKEVESATGAAIEDQSTA